MRGVARVRLIPGVSGGPVNVAPPPERRRRPGARCVFPLRFARQTIWTVARRRSDFSIEIRDVCSRVVPTHAHDRISTRLRKTGTFPVDAGLQPPMEAVGAATIVWCVPRLVHEG